MTEQIDNPAINKLDAFFQRYVDDALAQLADDPDAYHGGDWFQYTPAEREVFQIEPYWYVKALCAYERWQAFLDIIGGGPFDSDYADELAAEREAYDGLFARGHDAKGFMDYAKLACNLPNRQANAVYYKMAFAEIRRGLVRFVDEPEPKKTDPNDPFGDDLPF